MSEYCTLKEVKSELGNIGDDNDGMLAGMIEQASDFIDKFCRRSFGSTTATKYFDGAGKTLYIKELLSVTSLKLDIDGDGVFETTLSESDYILYPLNETPKTHIKLSPNSSYSDFASGIERGVEIAGSWGYSSSTPSPIKRAAIIQVCRWFKRKDSAFADVIGMAEMGQAVMYKGLDPDIETILVKAGYKKLGFA